MFRKKKADNVMICFDCGLVIGEQAQTVPVTSNWSSKTKRTFCFNHRKPYSEIVVDGEYSATELLFSETARYYKTFETDANGVPLGYKLGD